MRTISLFLIILLFSSHSYSQEDNATQQDIFLEAEYFLLNEDYTEALNLYLQLYEKLPENANLSHCIGICYLNIQGKKDKAIDYLERATGKMSASHKEGTITQTAAPYEALYNLAKAYRINFMFDKAIQTFQKYNETLLPDDKENRDFIEHEINVCKGAGKMLEKPVQFSEENMGEIFNDDNPDFNPVISADGKTFAWMVSLKFYDAVMLSRFVDDKWTAPVNITSELQSDGDFYLSSLSSDGKTLLLSKNDNFNSDIYISNYNGTIWSKAEKMNRNINTKYWESQGFISNDGRFLIFSSDRPGGYGGLDLYISAKSNGEWGVAVNMGPGINTQFNEDRPVMTNEGKKLYFSSQGHEGLGGYDFFVAESKPDQTWSKPVNLGYPINTPDDNFFFYPSENGDIAYYSTVKDSGGFGKEDIYTVTFEKK
ncbi:MAG TPA: tetratricopeptide repeat protein [Bacteroidales bacterium]|nr:tetratricopeptide repeat protein [Bacteroidales bacterium]